MKKYRIAKVAPLLLVFSIGSAACAGNPNDPEADVNEVEICVMDAGYRTEAFYALEEAFEKKYPEINVQIKPVTQINDKLTNELTRSSSTVDLWFAGEQNVISLVEKSRDCPFEDLTEMLNETADGESVKLIDKMDEQLKYYNTYTDADGKVHFYSVSWVYGACGLMYNADYVPDDQVPKTTNQLIALFDKILNKQLDGCSTKPLIWSGSSGSSYMAYAMETWKAQYMGVDSYNAMVNFYDGTEYTYSYLADDGVLHAYEVVKALAKDEYFVEGSKGFQHTPAQQDFLRGEGVFMPNGDWIETEMKKAMEESGTSITAKVKTLQMPVVSALGKKLYLAGPSASDAAHEEMLINLITAIDEGKTNGEIKESWNILTDEKIDAVREARSVVYSLGVSHRIYLPSSSNAKTASKKFIKFFASDEGTLIFRKYAGSSTPFKMTVMPEDEERSFFMQSQDKILKGCKIIYNGITKSYIRAYNDVKSDSSAFVQFVEEPSLTAKTLLNNYYSDVAGKWSAMKLIAGV